MKIKIPEQVVIPVMVEGNFSSEGARDYPIEVNEFWPANTPHKLLANKLFYFELNIPTKFHCIERGSELDISCDIVCVAKNKEKLTFRIYNHGPYIVEFREGQIVGELI